MTDKERYERAMRQDFPRDFVDDDYLINLGGDENKAYAEKRWS